MTKIEYIIEGIDKPITEKNGKYYFDGKLIKFNEDNYGQIQYGDNNYIIIKEQKTNFSIINQAQSILPKKPAVDFSSKEEQVLIKFLSRSKINIEELYNIKISKVFNNSNEIDRGYLSSFENSSQLKSLCKWLLTFDIQEIKKNKGIYMIDIFLEREADQIFLYFSFDDNEYLNYFNQDHRVRINQGLVTKWKEKQKKEFWEEFVRLVLQAIELSVNGMKTKEYFIRFVENGNVIVSQEQKDLKLLVNPEELKKWQRKSKLIKGEAIKVSNIKVKNVRETSYIYFDIHDNNFVVQDYNRGLYLDVKKVLNENGFIDNKKLKEQIGICIEKSIKKCSLEQDSSSEMKVIEEKEELFEEKLDIDYQKIFQDLIKIINKEELLISDILLLIDKPQEDEDFRKWLVESRLQPSDMFKLENIILKEYDEQFKVEFDIKDGKWLGGKKFNKGISFVFNDILTENVIDQHKVKYQFGQALLNAISKMNLKERIQKIESKVDEINKNLKKNSEVKELDFRRVAYQINNIWNWRSDEHLVELAKSLEEMALIYGLDGFSLENRGQFENNFNEDNFEFKSNSEFMFRFKYYRLVDGLNIVSFKKEDLPLESLKLSKEGTTQQYFIRLDENGELVLPQGVSQKDGIISETK